MKTVPAIPFPSTVVKNRLIIIVLMHALFATISLAMAFFLRFDFTLGGDIYYPQFLMSLPVNVVIFLVFSGIFNLYQGIWRYVSVEDLRDIIYASALASLSFMFVIIFSSKFDGFPRSIYLLNFTVFVVLNGGTRFLIRMFRESFAPQSDIVRNILIIGAGDTGNEIAKTLKSTKHKQYELMGFIDNDRHKHNKRLQGKKILGDLNSLRHHIKRMRIHEIFIAIPEATNKVVKEIMDAARIPDWEVKFKIVPPMLDIMSGKLQINQIHDVSISDLLSRPNITLDDTHVRKEIAGKTILISGAGGSIGTEICYQIAAYRPARMILLDSGEENAYHVDMGLKKRHPEIAIHTIVESLLESCTIDMIFKQFKPDFVLHAAAYKHVHLMEWSPFACLRNNVLGTANIASIAERNGVKQFVMISTDKAVNPRGIMGISKRLAERTVLERHPSNTIFNVVRFGNVLGSSGSVIPLFQRQIREGGPVTVTSPETKRYFMSIPEAVQLVLQASTLHEKNAIFVLEMGEPVKIVDLAKNLIELSGLKVGDDIEIVYTGLRPGEKMEEVLLTESEDAIRTSFDKIRLFRNKNYDPDKVIKFVHQLKSHIDLCNIKGLYNDMREMIPEMTGPEFEEVNRNLFA